MFRHKIVKAIKKGDLEAVNNILANEPYLYGQELKFNSNYYNGNLLHVAACFDQPAIIRFLVEKNMDVNSQDNWPYNTPLHIAAMQKSSAAVTTLLELGANPCLKGSSNQMPYEKGRDQGLKALLYNAAQEWQASSEEHVKQEAEEAHVAEENPQSEIVDKSKGFWTQSAMPHEYIFERELPKQGLRLTEIFNMVAEECTLVVRDIETGYPAQPVIRSFADMKDQTRVQEAKELCAGAASGRKLTSKPVLKMSVSK